MLFFSDKSNYPIGLDISDLSLKLVQLKKTGDKIKIQAINKIALPNGILENGEIIDKEKMIKAVREISRRLPPRN
jgi:Tfp pilus assembly PilM family ATPase